MAIEGAEIDGFAGAAAWAKMSSHGVPASSAARIVGDHSMSPIVSTISGDCCAADMQVKRHPTPECQAPCSEIDGTQ
jgi:hypothetical protein